MKGRLNLLKTIGLGVLYTKAVAALITLMLVVSGTGLMSYSYFFGTGFVSSNMFETTVAPELDPIDNQTVRELDTLVFNVSATHPNNATITLTAQPLPSGAVFTDHGDGNGTFEWTPLVGQAGTHEVTITADHSGFSDTIVVVITVIPFLLPIPVLVIDPPVTGSGVPVTLDASGSHALDSELVRLTVDPGDGSPPFEATNPQDAVFVHEYDAVRNYTVHLEVENEYGATNQTTGRVDVGTVENPDQQKWYVTIQDGVDDAEPGQRIHAHPANYTQDVVVSTDGLTIRSVEPDMAVLRPEQDVAMDIRAQNITVEDFRVELDDAEGLRVDKQAGGNVTIRGLDFTTPGLGLAQEVDGAFHYDGAVGNESTGTSVAVNATDAAAGVSLLIEGNEIRQYDTAFVVDGVGAVSIRENEIRETDKGIRLLEGAENGTIVDNFVWLPGSVALEIDGVGHNVTANQVLLGVTATAVLVAGDFHQIMENEIQEVGEGIRLTPEAGRGSQVEGNDIRDGSIGIRVETGVSGTPVFLLNKIHGNDIGLMAEADTSVDARYNWWGHASGPILGDPVEGTLNFIPWCTTPECTVEHLLGLP